MTLSKLWGIVSPFVTAALILIIGHFLIVYLLKFLDKAFFRTKADQSLIRFLHKATSLLAHSLVGISALTSLGVSTTGLVATLSAVAVGVSVALKDSLGNVVGGILLLLSPRFATGDYIGVGGDEGTVISVDLLHTTIRTFDSKLVSIPNGVLINSHIIDYSRERQRRVDLVFPIGYEADVELAKRLARETMAQHPLTLREPEEPFSRVRDYGDSAVNLVARVWCKTEDYWTVYYDLTEGIRAVFAEHGIEIPYNQLDVHVKSESVDSPAAPDERIG